MPIEILMPALSPTMKEGKIIKWRKKEGDMVCAGDVIADIETDKAVMEFEAADDGRLGRVLITEGTKKIAVNTPICVLVDEDEDISSIESYTPATPLQADKVDAEIDDVTAVTPARDVSDADRIKASPLAKAIAKQHKLDLDKIDGTGPGGRIVKDDVLKYYEQSRNDNIISLPVFYGRNPEETYERELSSMRQIIAERLIESKRNIPHFYLTIDCNIDDLIEMRHRMNNSAIVDDQESPRYKLTVNDFIIKAAALALHKIPNVNASWGGDKIIFYNNIDISIAVGLEDGLITPIIRNADQKSLSQISNEIKGLVKRARTAKLVLEEFQGGGFTISNLGMYNIKEFGAIINPPQSAILAIGAAEKRPVVDCNGRIKAATMMNVTLSVDHRVIDGALGANWLNVFKRHVENPVTMLV